MQNRFLLAVIITLFVGISDIYIKNGRILNGNTAPASEYTVRVTSYSNTRPEVLGSGILVSSRHVLTVGHLVSGYSSWTIGYGNSTVSLLTNITSNVAIIHPDYEFNNNNEGLSFTRNDLGIIFAPINQLDISLIRPIPLPTTLVSLPRPNEEGRVVGFGATGSNFLPSTELREVFLTTLNATRCQAAFSSFSSDSFCAVDEHYLGNVCFGDIGSAYTVRYQGVPVLAGLNVIVSNCTPGTITGYVRIQNHIEWIRNIIG